MPVWVVGLDLGPHNRFPRSLWENGARHPGVTCSSERNRYCAVPGKVIAPWNEPEVGDGCELNRTRRSTVKPPVASANRPVPPVIVLISTIRLRPGIPTTGSPCPTMVVVIISPFFAVNSAEPEEDPAGRLTVTL